LRKRKEEALRTKIEIFRKVEPKLFEANEFFQMEGPESAKLRVQTRNQPRLHYASDKNIPRKSIQDDLLVPTQMRVNSKFEFVSEEAAGTRASCLSIFNNNFLTLLPTQSVALVPTNVSGDSTQLQPPTTTRAEEPKRNIDFKIRRKEPPVISPEKGRHSCHNIESLIPKRKDPNIFKSVLESLKKR